MTSLQRVRNTVQGRPVDHLACQPMLMMFSARHAGIPYIEYTRDGRKMAAAQIKCWHDFGVDAIITCSDPAREVIDLCGEDSVEWFVDQGPATQESRAALSDKSRLKTLRLPDLNPKGRMYDRLIAIEIMRREVGQETSVVGWVEGPLALAAELRGINNMMVDFIDDPGFAHDLLDFCTDVACVYSDAQIAAGVDTVAMSDAAACMVGPQIYRDFIHPRQKRAFQHIKDRDPKVMTRSHMCGNTNTLAADMATLPVDIYEIDFPADLSLVKSKLGNRVVSGNVSTITDMLEGSPAQVYAAAAHCHQICGERHIVNPGCEVSPLSPPENVEALVRYAHEH